MNARQLRPGMSVQYGRSGPDFVNNRKEGYYGASDCSYAIKNETTTERNTKLTERLKIEAK